MAILKTRAPAEPETPAGGLSIVAVGMTVRGDLESNGTVKVEGTVAGRVEARHQVLVAKGGVVDGDIDAREAVIGGRVSGAVRGTERVEIQAGAVVNGDITTRRIAVAEGASLNGLVRMAEQGAAAKPGEARAGQAVAAPGAGRAPVVLGRPAPRLPAQGASH